MRATTEPLVKLLADTDVSVITGLARSTLSKMRFRGNGPPFVKISGAIRYPEDTLRDWCAALPRRTRTA